MTNSIRTVRFGGTCLLPALALCCGLLATASISSQAQAQALPATTSPDGKVRLEILSLKRTEGDTVTLRFQIINDSSNDYGVTIGNMRLIDIAGRRTYSPGIMSNTCYARIGEKLACYAVVGSRHRTALDSR